ncbi:unnamed protein product [Prorocentrum cordatum]|uniref:Uncharacterized protein n=1 Tax=Prorocentrum cordatum TaxID=2364126 RepID=A0ABN9TFG3_9DINO|nr:unnamed protein product [Polarella glacialis]
MQMVLLWPESLFHMVLVMLVLLPAFLMPKLGVSSQISMFLKALSLTSEFNILIVMQGICRKLFVKLFTLPIVWDLLSLGLVSMVAQLFLYIPLCLKLLAANLILFVESLLQFVQLEDAILNVMSQRGCSVDFGGYSYRDLVQDVRAVCSFLLGVLLCSLCARESERAAAAEEGGGAGDVLPRSRRAEEAEGASPRPPRSRRK